MTGKVSNLVNRPRLNEKYTDAWFLKENPQYWANLRAMESLQKVVDQEEDDPIMKLNPTLYNQVKKDGADKLNMTEAFESLMHQQRNQNVKTQGYIKDTLHRVELDHPNSLHNLTTGKKMHVKFPESSNDPMNQQDHLKLNGYYDLESYHLKNAFQPPEGPVPIDNRLMNGAQLGERTHQPSELEYQANHELLAEIERNKKLFNQKVKVKAPVQQQIEEISPSGIKRQIGFQNHQESIQAQNPFIEQESPVASQPEAPGNMFSVQLNPSIEDCRKQLPDRLDGNSQISQDFRGSMNDPGTGTFQYTADAYVQSNEPSLPTEQHSLEKSPNKGILKNDRSPGKSGGSIRMKQYDSASPYSFPTDKRVQIVAPDTQPRQSTLKRSYKDSQSSPGQDYGEEDYYGEESPGPSNYRSEISENASEIQKQIVE